MNTWQVKLVHLNCVIPSFKPAAVNWATPRRGVSSLMTGIQEAEACARRWTWRAPHSKRGKDQTAGLTSPFPKLQQTRCCLKSERQRQKSRKPRCSRPPWVTTNQSQSPSRAGEPNDPRFHICPFCVAGEFSLCTPGKRKECPSIHMQWRWGKV